MQQKNLQVGREIRFVLHKQPTPRTSGCPNRPPSPRLTGFNPVTAAGLSSLCTLLTSGIIVLLQREKVRQLNLSPERKDPACSLLFPQCCSLHLCCSSCRLGWNDVCLEGNADNTPALPLPNSTSARLQLSVREWELQKIISYGGSKYSSNYIIKWSKIF